MFTAELFSAWEYRTTPRTRDLIAFRNLYEIRSGLRPIYQMMEGLHGKAAFQRTGMKLIEWNESLRIDVSQFDSQHRKLFDIVNRLKDSNGNGIVKRGIPLILHDLLLQTLTHFRDEEKFMHSIGYDGLVDHARRHSNLIHELQDKIDHFNESRSIDMLLPFLDELMSEHIMLDDRKFAEFFRLKGRVGEQAAGPLSHQLDEMRTVHYLQ